MFAVLLRNVFDIKERPVRYEEFIFLQVEFAIARIKQAECVRDTEGGRYNIIFGKQAQYYSCLNGFGKI